MSQESDSSHSSGAKASLVWVRVRGPEGPLFHVGASIIPWLELVLFGWGTRLEGPLFHVSASIVLGLRPLSFASVRGSEGLLLHVIGRIVLFIPTC